MSPHVLSPGKYSNFILRNNILTYWTPFNCSKIFVANLGRNNIYWIHGRTISTHPKHMHISILKQLNGMDFKISQQLLACYYKIYYKHLVKSYVDGLSDTYWRVKSYMVFLLHRVQIVLIR